MFLVSCLQFVICRLLFVDGSTDVGWDLVLLCRRL